MLVETISAAPQVSKNVPELGRSPSLADAAASEWRRVESVDYWPAFGRLLVWATRNNHPRRPGLAWLWHRSAAETAEIRKGRQ
jgi:hypothetical protein